MSAESELERLLREASRTLPEPDAPATGRAHDLALAAVGGRRPRRRRLVALLGVALVVAVGLGVGIGALIAPSGTAARGPVGFGFLPEPGWFAFQTGRELSTVYQTTAVASNVPLHPEDEVAGAADQSGLPYATLLELPPEGIVIVASFTPPNQPAWFGSPPDQELPLRIGEATPYIRYGTQVRPARPLGQYEIRAAVNGHSVNVNIYFGTPNPPSALRDEAQRQLEKLVVGREGLQSRPARGRNPSTITAGAQSVTMTFVRFYDNACKCYKARVSGRVSSGKAGEYVVVLHQYCGRSSGRSVAAATTRDGGFWEAEIAPVARPDFPSAESYFARWNNEVSEPVTFRGRLSSVSGMRVSAGRQTVTVVTPNYNPVSLKGRQIVLQRQVAGQWRRIAGGRLAPHKTRFYTFTATFTVPRRGWVLRVLVPSKTVAPCFTPTASEPWRS